MRERPDELHEQMLVTRAQSGDELAFHGLVCIYAARLRYFLRKLVGNDAVEDVLQDVWLVVHRELRKLRSPVSFRPSYVPAYRGGRSRNDCAAGHVGAAARSGSDLPTLVVLLPDQRSVLDLYG